MNFRSIHRREGIWRYHVGDKYALIYSPTKRRLQVPLTDIYGATWEAIEHDKLARGFSITPEMIRNYIAAP